MFIYDQITRHMGGGNIQPTTLIGVLFGILSGVASNRYKHIKLPEAVQFFGGSRFVLLFMGLFSTLFSWALLFITPYLQKGLDELTLLMNHLGGFGLFLYGILYRVLTAFGLHHLLNNIFWFQAGSYQTPSGNIVQGDLPRFFAGDPTAGGYMAGLFPIMMFALPAIALAIIQEAREDLKPKIKKTFLTAALVCFLTGVSEQIEFAFLFAAPYLFILHAVLSGAAMWLTYELDIHHGFSYSAGAIDFFLNLHLSHHAWLLIPIGIGYGFVYYFLFRWAIRRFQIPTPAGRKVRTSRIGRGAFPTRRRLFWKRWAARTTSYRWNPALPGCG
ncbi:PTS system glucose-specific EIICBA component [Paenibacillus sp. P1XP2]|nr:PTS system glucose-specific EIICBA component [Paenibacillus sp. P1XP2]